MSTARDTRRLHRGLAAVESRYVRDLGTRQRPGRSPTPTATSRTRTRVVAARRPRAPTIAIGK